MSHNYFYATMPINAKDGDIRAAVMDSCGYEWNGESERYMYEVVAAMNVRRMSGCYTRKEAERIIKDNDDFYWGGYIKAVPFYEGSNKKIVDLERRIKETQEKYDKYLAAHRVGDYKALFVGCPECQSKIARFYFENNKTKAEKDRCPVCHADMASDTTKKTLQRYRGKVNELKKEKEAELKKLAKKPTHFLAVAGVHS